MRRYKPPLIAVAVAIALVAYGCTAAPTSAPSASPTPRGDESANPSPQASTPSIPSAKPADCDNLLDPETLATLTNAGEGFAYYPELLYWPLSKFEEYGGAGCAWGFPNSDVGVGYGWSPLTPEQRATEIDYIESFGGTYLTVDGGRLYTMPDADASYLIVDDYWAAASSTSQLHVTIDELVANAPST